MKKRISIVAGLLAMGCANISIVRAQPPENPALALAAQKVKLNVQRAEADAVVVAFATETLRSQSPADYARLPMALRDALPYWLEDQPFEAWSPELQRFAKENFQKLAADTKVETWEPAIRNKAAIIQWLQEKAPFENTQLQFYLAISPIFIGKRLDGVKQLESSQQVSTGKFEPSRVIALGHLIKSLSPQQKVALFANNMHLSMAELSPEQKQNFEEIHNGHGDMKIDTPNGEISIYQSPKSEIALDFRFMVIAQRNIGGKKDYFEAQIARPFDYLRI